MESFMPQPTTPSTPGPSLEGTFLRTLVGLIRAEDSYGAWDRKSDADLLRPFVLTAQARAETPVVGDPEPETVHRVEQFYRAVALIVEQRSRMMASSLMTMGGAGSGRFILTVGRVVAHDVTLREVHRFGFGALEDIARLGEAAVESALATLERFPEAARD
jgi:probable nitrogen fixation protein